jgi:hypothetical protein
MANLLKRVIGQHRILALVAILLIAAGAVFLALRVSRPPVTPGGGQQIPVQVDQPEDTRFSGGLSPVTDQPQTVSIRLGEGQAQPQAAQPLAVVTGEPLTPGEIDAVLSRLPQFEGQPGDQVEFRPAGDPIPPPRTGETIKESFPPPPEALPPAAVETGPLEVLRYLS